MSSLSDIPPLLSPPPPLPASYTSSNPDILLRIETPYKADAFDRFFANYPHLKSRYPHLTDKLRRGFPMGDFPESLDQTQTWENGRSVQEHCEFVDEYFAEEVQAGRLSGPYPQSVVEGILGGHFQCSPITVNVQPQGLGEEPKLRLCSDFSRGSISYPATNDYSDIRDFPTRFGGVLQVADEVAKAPPGSQAMTLDISKFHRRTPIAPAHKKWFVMQARPGEFYIQHSCPFGARASEGNSGEVANAALDIWRELGVQRIYKWADDMVVFRSPIANNTYPYSRADALARIESLGIPWHPEKGQDFASRFTYVGFEWDLNRKSVSLPQSKREAFLQRLKEYLQLPAVSRMDSMIIHGTLAHVVYVYPEGRTRLLQLSRFISSFGTWGLPGVQLKLPVDLIHDLSWWKETLTRVGAARSVVPKMPARDLHISVDASGDWGIGIVFGRSWDAWKSKTPGRHIGWLEGVAVELTAYILESRSVKDTHVLIHSDNQSVIGAFNKGSSRNVEINLSIQRAGISLLACNNSLELQYVRSEENPADPVSRGKLGLPSTRMPPIQLPEELRPYLDSRASALLSAALRVLMSLLPMVIELIC